MHHALRYKIFAEHLIQYRVIRVFVWLQLPIPVNSALVSTHIVYARSCNGISALSDTETVQEGSDVEEACAVKRRTLDAESTDDDMDLASVANTHHGQAGHMPNPNGEQLNASSHPFQMAYFAAVFLYFYRVTACNATHGIPKAFLSVCLSVCQTCALWQNERNLCSNSYIPWKIIYPSFLTRNLLTSNEPFGTFLSILFL